MKTKFKYKGTIQTSGKWIIPFVVGYSISNVNYNANVYTLHILMIFHISFSWKKSEKLPNISDIVELARYYAYKWHRNANQYYGKGENEVPYEYHLEMVEEECIKYEYLLPDKETRHVVRAGCLVHDSIEDTRVTWNDVKSALLNEQVANFAYALCNEKGKNRKARANSKYYAGIRDVKYATFIKLCDRLANVKYSLSPEGGRMADGYRKENPQFEKELYTPEYDDMFQELRKLLS